MPKPETRVSDAERDKVVELLTQAVGEGRLTLEEFEERLSGVLAATTHAELAPFTADLPQAAAPEVAELRSRASALKRTGRWVVPRRLVVQAQESSVKLDFTAAAIATPTVEVQLDVRASAVTLILPKGASASLDDIEVVASSTKTTVPDAGGLHVVVRGRMKASSLRVRYQRRFLFWRW